jgi:hypothetical protein
MIRSIFLIHFISLSAILSAQELTFTHGKPIEQKLSYYDKKYGRQEFKYTYFDTVSRTAYDKSWEDENVNIKIFKDYVNQSSTIKNFDIKKAANNSNALLKTFLNIGHKYYVIYSTNNGGEATAFIQEIDADLNVTGKAQPLATFQIAKENDSFGIYPSKDGKQILFIRKYPDGIQEKSFSDSFAALWSKTFEVKTEDLILRTANVTEDGYLNIGGYYYKKRKIVDPFVIVYSTKTQQHHVNFFPKEEGVELFNFNMTLLNDNDPLVACLYSKKRELGYRLYKINTATLTIDNFATQPISAEFKKATNLGYKDENFIIANIGKLQNGNVVFSIEGQVNQSAHNTGNISHSASFYTSPTNVIAVNSSGTEEWDKLVRKFQQQSSASHLIGHYFFHSNNKVYVVYNDVNENFSLSPFVEQKAWVLKEKNMYVAIAEIDEKGNAKKLNLITKNPKEVSYFYVEDTEKITDKLFRFKITTPMGTHYSLLQVK